MKSSIVITVVVVEVTIIVIGCFGCKRRISGDPSTQVLETVQRESASDGMPTPIVQTSPTAAQEKGPKLIKAADGTWMTLGGGTMSQQTKELIASGRLRVQRVDLESSPIPGHQYYKKEGNLLVLGTVDSQGIFRPDGQGNIDISKGMPISLHHLMLPMPQKPSVTIIEEGSGHRYEAITVPGKPTQFRELQ